MALTKVTQHSLGNSAVTTAKLGTAPFGFANSSANIVFMAANGNIGINDSSPEAGAKLSIKGGGIAIATDTSAVSANGYDLKIRSATSKIGVHAIASSQNMFLEFSGGGGAAAYINVASSDSLVVTTNSIERMRIDASGRMTRPYQPMFWAYRSGSGNLTSETDLSCDVADVNVGSHYSTSTFRFTAPVAGTYFFIMHAMNNQSNPGSSTVKFSKNGTNYHYFHIVNSHPSSGTSNIIMTLVAGDYVSCSATNIHWNGGSLYKYPVFGGFLIG